MGETGKEGRKFWNLNRIGLVHALEPVSVLRKQFDRKINIQFLVLCFLVSICIKFINEKRNTLLINPPQMHGHEHQSLASVCTGKVIIDEF